MRFLSYKTCEKIHKLKIGVPSKWWWAVDNEFVGQQGFYGLFIKTKERDGYMTYFHKAYTMDDIPAILLKLWQKTVNKNKKKLPDACVEYFQDLSTTFAKMGHGNKAWNALEKEFNTIVDSHVKNNVYGRK